MKVRLLLSLFLLTIAFSLKCMYAFGQQGVDIDSVGISQSIHLGNQYLEGRVDATNKYIRQCAHIQRRLIRKLKKKEKRMSALDASSDSMQNTVSYNNTISYDSLLVLAKDPSLLYNKGSPKTNAVIDSLKGIQNFIQYQSGKLQKAAALANQASLPSGSYTAQLNELQQKLNAQDELNKLIQQKTSSFESHFLSEKMVGIQSLQKDLAIAKSKIKCWKQAADDPDAAEEKAYEYLQGTEGFENYLNTNKNNAFGGLGNNASAADLQKMGYQLKGQVSDMLKQQFGNRLGEVQQQMGQQINQYTKQLDKIKSTVSETKNTYAQAKQDMAQTRQQLQQAEQAAFRNPMRGIPFRQRFKYKYDFQTTKAMADGRPVLLDLGASISFEQSPKWRWGAGLSTDIGLGQDWQHLRLSYEGISLRVFVDREMVLGISMEGGYERRFLPANRDWLQADPERQVSNQSGNIVKDAFGVQQQSAYLGLMKSYHINKKWKGTIMAGYDFLWQRYGLRSPLMIRFGWAGN